MALRLFDSAANEKLVFEPRTPPHVGLYVCGITAYDLCHLGHARSVVVWDVLQRHLRARGYALRYVRNITDIDDKIIRRAAERNEEPGALAERFIAEMHRDFASLGLDPPDIEPRATEHVAEMIAHIAGLIERKLAYASAGDVYFRVRDFPGYGALLGQSLDELMVGARVEPTEKKEHQLDFVLWKAAKPGEPRWNSPWGPGRPGWHIECSAMAAQYLGPSFDLHAGGKDLLFPHHTNEIAQSQGLYGAGTFARYWMHNGFLNLDDEKMSKSLGNVFTIRRVTELYEGEALRLYLLGVHYRSPLSIDTEPGPDGGARFPGVAEAERRLEYYYSTLARIDATLGAQSAAPPPDASSPEIERFRAAFEEALDDDLNTAVALAALGEAATFANQVMEGAAPVAKNARRPLLAKLRTEITSMGSRLGLLARPPGEFLRSHRTRLAGARGIDEAEIDRLVEERNAARRAKDFQSADRIRDALAARGIELMDSAQGTNWRFRRT